MAKGEKKDRYAEAGVDIEAGKRFVESIKPIVSKTFKSGVITDIGGFSGLFSLKTDGIKNPVLTASTDGVGTKLKIAFMMDKHDTVGIDLVAMCANDVMWKARPHYSCLTIFPWENWILKRRLKSSKGSLRGAWRPAALS